MKWSIFKTLRRTGFPAIGLFIAKVVFELTGESSGTGAVEIVWLNALMITMVWLVISVVLWLVIRLVPRRAKSS